MNVKRFGEAAPTGGGRTRAPRSCSARDVVTRAIDSSLEYLPYLIVIARAVLLAVESPEPRGVQSVYDVLESKNRKRRPHPRRSPSLDLGVTPDAGVPGTEALDIADPGVLGAEAYRSEPDSDSDSDSDSESDAESPTVSREIMSRDLGPA